MNGTSEVAYARLRLASAGDHNPTTTRQATSTDDKTINTQLNKLSRDAKVGGHRMVRTMGSTSATKSTGPRTSEGRAVSARNGQKHGLRSEAIALLPSESAEAWQCLLDGLRNDLNPVGMTEDLLVEKMALSVWKSRRAEHFEVGALVMSGAAEDGVGVAAWRDANLGQAVGLTIRYRRASDAAFYAAKHELERQQARRKLPEGATMPTPMAIDLTVAAAGSEPEDEP